MQFALSSRAAASYDGECLIIGRFQDGALESAAADVDQATGGRLSRLAEAGDLPGQPGEHLWLHNLDGLKAGRVLLMGCGPRDRFAADQFRNVSLQALRLAAESPARKVSTRLTELPVQEHDAAWRVRQTALLAHEACYRYSATLSEQEGRPREIDVLTVAGSENAAFELRVGDAMGAGADLARELGNLPPNICTPEYLANQAQQIAKSHKTVKVTILKRADMEKAGMGALLSVAAGSTTEPRLISARYTGAGSDVAPIALVGKGVTFDTGGISLKPGAAMDEMKFDMCGAASVIGTLEACARLELPLNLVAVVPATDNMPDGSATHPGDIVKSMSGQTVEILNTDAEGRLILCDALTWCEQFKPSTVIDIATLTGACVVALGRYTSGLLSNEQRLADELLEAGRNAGDLAWQLPLFDAYQELLKSPFADMANIGGKEAGTITAACFLSRYTKKFRWAHLDIAGTAWRSNQDKGATGRPVPLLVQFLVDRAGPQSNARH